MKKFIFLFGFIIIASCSKPAEYSSKPVSDASTASEISSPLQKIALDYAVGLKLPENNIEAVLKSHRSLCENAGSDKCQILSYEYNNSDGPVRANLSIRAIPTYILPFRDGLSFEAQKLNGKVSFDRTNAVNLTSEIDSQTSQVIQNKADIERIKNELANPKITQETKIEYQKQLSELEQTLNANKRQLSTSNARVDMSILNIDYASKKGGITKSSLQPVVQALENVWDIFFFGVSALILVAAAVLPFGLALLLFSIIAKSYKNYKNRKQIKEKTE